ncbi:MFS transporter [Candidatus Bathyarchaeota archaeon]|nr:MFS transporter [Candidatus Bathyarchaeota archaeon]MBS7630699.1 MFS transporter [Candidatus Bathyarchaeota archaeon]
MGQEIQRSRFWYITQNVKVLIVTRLLWGISRGVATPFLSLYILALGGTPIEIGFVNMLGLIAGIFLYPLGGYIADKKGRVKLIIYSTIIFTISGLFFVFAWSWEIIAIGHFITQMMLFYSPALNALEADSLPLNVERDSQSF